MTTIVRHRRTGNEYILLTINGEAGKANPSRFISELFDREKPEVSCSATICDVRGNIFLANIDDLIVMEIDGKKPADLLPEPEPTYTVVDSEVYPEQTDDFDEEELEEEFDGDRQPTHQSQTSVYDRSSSVQSNIDEDDEDWI